MMASIHNNAPVRAFTFRVPYTNPFYLAKRTSGGFEGRVWDDSDANEWKRPYVQVWEPGDMLSFQFSWENIAAGNANTITVAFVVNGATSRSGTFTIGSTLMQGTLYSEFIVQKRAGAGYNGLYAFSQKISDIVSAGDCFRIVLTDPTGAVWESNKMMCVQKAKGTRLIHYSDSASGGRMANDTFFGYMPYGYDLRLPASITEINPEMNQEVFQEYAGGYDLVSATPFETVKLTVGDNGIRMPRYYIRMFNTIMACDSKSIDGVPFESVGDSLSVDRVAGYANDVYSVRVSRRRNALSYESSGRPVFASFVNLLQQESRQSGVTGTITVNSSDDWYIDGQSVSSAGLELSSLSGSSGERTIRFDGPANNEEGDITKSIVFRSLSDGSQLGVTYVTLRSVPAGGIGSMKIGDNFIVSK